MLQLEHTVPVEIAGSGAGALYVGPGWDLSILALGPYLRGELPEVADRLELANAPEIQQFSQQSVHAWVDVVTASGTATAEEIAAATEASLAQFAPDRSND